MRTERSKVTRKLIPAICFLLFAATPALAQESGFYLGIHGGGAFMEGAENSGETGSFNLEFKPGYLAGITLGFDLREDFPRIGIGRMEIEISHRTSDLDEAEFVDGNIATEGEATVTSVMLNTFGEYRDSAPWIPYLGAGIGWARVSLQDVEIFGGTLVDDEDDRFAFQAGAGLGYEVGPHLTFDLGYRYFAVMDPEFRDSEGERFESEYRAHQVQLGMRWNF